MKYDSLIMKYRRKNFWGRETDSEDKLFNPKRKDILKCFRAMKQCTNSCEPTLQINFANSREAVIIYFDSYDDIANGLLTVRECNGGSYYDVKQSFEVVKKKYVPVREEE